MVSAQLGMEQQGGAGTRGSHWEQKTMLYDVMGGMSETGPVWTKMTLGFLYDTGKMSGTSTDCTGTALISPLEFSAERNELCDKRDHFASCRVLHG